MAVNYGRENTTACASRPILLGHGHDRLVAQPTSRELAHAGMVLGRDGTSRIQVGIELVATIPTFEYALGAAVVAGCMPTPAACLGGMTRIDRDHRTTPLFGLVLNFRLEAGEWPRVYPALSFRAPFGLHPCANMLEVFHHDRAAWLGGPHDLLAQDVIGIPPKPCSPALDPFQMPFGAFRASLLQRAGQREVAALDRLPLLLAKKLVVRRDRWTVDAQIDADQLIRWRNVRCRDAHDDVQPPLPIPLDKISAIGRMADILGGVVGDREADYLPARRGADAHGLAFPIDAVGMFVVARRAGVRHRHCHLPTRLFECKCTSQRLGCLDPRLVDQITDQRRVVGLERVVRQVVQLGRIRDAFVPAQAHRLIEGARKLAAAFRQCISLGWGWF